MQNKPKTIKELCEFIWYLEEKYDLLDYEISGVKFWQYARMSIYYDLAQKLGILSQPHSKQNLWRRIRSLFQYKFLLNSLKDNFFTLPDREIVVIPHPRTVNVDGDSIDIYTKFLVDDLQEKYSVLELVSPYLGVYARRSTNNTQYIDWIRLPRKILEMLISVCVIEGQKLELRVISKEIEETLGIYFDVERFAVKKCKIFKSLYFFYDLILRKIKPSALFVVVAYGQAPIIKAAKDLGIEVIELQHGTFSEYHLGYSFPDRTQSLEYFPDKFYVWSEYWKSLINFPLEPQKVVVDSFRFLEIKKENYAHLEKDDKQIVVLSQGAIGRSIAEKILDNLEKFEGSMIMYKLHPGEFDRWEEYPELRKLSTMQNVKIIKNEIPLYKLLATSGTQIGVFSTALYEGVEFGCKTVLLDLPGIEYMDKFASSYNAEIIK